MKRDMDLCRKILLADEEQYTGEPLKNLMIEGYSAKEISYHCNLLYLADYLEDYEAASDYEDPFEDEFGDEDNLFDFTDPDDFYVTGLSWEGHEFLEKIRQEETWTKVKNLISQYQLPVTMEVIERLLSEITDQALNEALQ